MLNIIFKKIIMFKNLAKYQLCKSIGFVRAFEIGSK